MRHALLFPFLLACSLGLAQDQPSKAEQKAVALLAKGKPYKALAICADHLDRGRVEPRFHLIRAEAYNSIGEPLKGEAAARLALAHDPRSVNALLQLGIAEQGLGRNDSAAVHLQRVMDLGPSPKAAYHMALTRQQQRDPAAALNILDGPLAMAAAPADRARAERMRGECQAQLGDTAAASASFEQALALDERDPVTWNSRGFHRYASFGDHARAVRDYDQAIKLNPNYGYAFNNRGWSLYKLGEVEKALKNIDLSLRKRQDNPYAYRNLGVIRLEQGQVKEGCQALRTALDMRYTALFDDEVERLVAERCPAQPPPPVQPPSNAPAPRSNAPDKPATPRTNAP
jgi:tetratricopeptide (TPR) repeat protein